MMCGPQVWGFGWMFPLVGLFVCLGIGLLAFRFVGAGRGCMCMGGHRGTRNDQPVS